MGRALERCATRIIATQASDDCGVQIEAAAKGGGIESKLPTVYLDAARIEEIGMRVGLATGQADRKVRSDPIINAHGKAACGQIVAARVGGAIHIGELPKACGKDPPTVLRDRRKYCRIALTLRSAHSREAFPKARPAAVDCESRRTKTAAARADVLHAPLQVGALHIGKRDAKNENGSQLLGGDSNEILREVG